MTSNHIEQALALFRRRNHQVATTVFMKHNHKAERRMSTLHMVAQQPEQNTVFGHGETLTQIPEDLSASSLRMLHQREVASQKLLEK